MAQLTARPKVNIRPASSVYATYRRLSYTPWHALAEFVDNSTQNYYDHRDALLEAYRREGTPGKLRVEIAYDHESRTLTIYDNANGMNLEELTRAIVLDRPPPIRSGRCEFGMGLKTAACWFGSAWTIETSRLGLDREYRVTINVRDLVEKQLDEVEIEESPADPDAHFTRLTITGLYKPIRGRTTGRIRDQLGSTYRVDLRSQEVEILWNGEPVRYEDPTFLEEDLGGGVKNVWRKDINLSVLWEVQDQLLPVRGWIGLRIPGSQRDAGFALLRRGRVIVGGPGENYKPVEIFGQGNTFRSQRLVGELHLDDWPVSQAKDAFDWSGGLEDAFIEELRRACQDYMDKAEGYRERKKPITSADVELASDGARRIFTDPSFARDLVTEIRFPDPPPTPEQEKADVAKLQQVSQGPLIYRLDLGTEEWVFRLHWQDQLSDAHWMQVSYPQDHIIDIFLNIAHPFFEPHLHDRGGLELIQKFVMAMALAEKLARLTAGDRLINPGDFRVLMNRVLRRASEIKEGDG